MVAVTVNGRTLLWPRSWGVPLVPVPVREAHLFPRLRSQSGARERNAKVRWDAMAERLRNAHPRQEG